MSQTAGAVDASAMVGASIWMDGCVGLDGCIGLNGCLSLAGCARFTGLLPQIISGHRASLAWRTAAIFGAIKT